MRESSLEEVLEVFFKYKTTDMFTALPCRIVKIRAELGDQRVDVQPMPLRKLRDGSTSEITPILNVPVMFPASRKASITFPLEEGDTVLCVFSQRSMDAFKAASGNDLYEPQDNRRFSVRDACAIPGLMPFELAVNDPAKHTWEHSTKDVVVVNNIGSGQENEVRLKANGDVEVKTNQDLYGTFNSGTIDCSTLTINCTSMTVNGDLSVSGSVDVGGDLTVASDITSTAGNITATAGDVVATTVSLMNHVHGGVTSGNSSTAKPTV